MKFQQTDVSKKDCHRDAETLAPPWQGGEIVFFAKLTGNMINSQKTKKGW